MTDPLTEYLRSVYPLSAGTITWISQQVSSVRYSKGHILAHPGSVVGEIWFIRQGLVKAYEYDVGGKCIIASFWQDHELVIIPECIFGAQRALQYIEVMEESTIDILDSQPLKKLSPDQTEIFELNQRLILSAFKRIEEKAALISCSADQRYRYFKAHFPWSRISVADTAAYLGLTRETVSQIRNRV